MSSVYFGGHRVHGAAISVWVVFLPLVGIFSSYNRSLLHHAALGSQSFSSRSAASGESLACCHPRSLRSVRSAVETSFARTLPRCGVSFLINSLRAPTQERGVCVLCGRGVWGGVTIKLLVLSMPYVPRREPVSAVDGSVPPSIFRTRATALLPRRCMITMVPEAIESMSSWYIH